MNSKVRLISTKYFQWSYILRAVMIISIILAIWKRDYIWIIGTFIGLFISFIPTILHRDAKMTLPWILDFLIAVVSILHMGGRLLDAYYNIPGYLLFTRFFISLLVGFIAFAIIFVLDEYWDGLKMDKYAMAFVVVIATMTIGVILEFLKWLNITGRYTEITNNILMLNLLADTVAGIVIAFIGVYLIKKGEFDDITEDFGQQINKNIIQRAKK